MGELYRLRMGHRGWTKLQCLTAAQQEMVDGILSESPDSPSSASRSAVGNANGSARAAKAPAWPKNLPPYSHPYYWAPFVLTGNWQ
jgi:CHAT domain-containing protein